MDLPLDTINAESKREKSIRHGHPSTLHIWWARRPLAACRAVVFASIVDDPSSCPDEFPTEEDQRIERKRLHNIIRKIVKWENTDESDSESRRIQNEARYEIARSVARACGDAVPCPDDPDTILQYLQDRAPPIHDPFAGGGSIPLESQRLGLRATASDLNPVAVLINKALIELPSKFAGRSPINPQAMGMVSKANWNRATGLASDIRYYGSLMRDEAEKRIGHIYPKIELPNGKTATVIAWLWARTVPCPNPACGIIMPLITQFQLSIKPKNLHWIKPVVDNKSKTVSFTVQNHSRNIPSTGTVRRNSVTCIACNTTSPLAYVREQSKAGTMSEQMVAIVAKGDRNRIFFSPTDEHINMAYSADPNIEVVPKQKIPSTSYKISGLAYGITQWRDLFTKRQLVLLTTLIETLPIIRRKILKKDNDTEYANAICTYLALTISKLADSQSSFATYLLPRENVAHVFARQAIPMVWDFAEGNPFSNAAGTLSIILDKVAKVVEALPATANMGKVKQANASTNMESTLGSVIVTDPPYYDNISYAELSDFFYVWLRPLLRNTYPDLFASIMTPVDDEMIASPRFTNARERFEDLMSRMLKLIHKHSNPEFPSSIFYAYRQQEVDRDGVSSTGWDTILSALASAEFQIVGTWPMRTEFSGRSNALKANTLASSVILVCRTRPRNASITTRREFVSELRSQLPQALRHMQDGNIAPVDLAQAAIGPGIAIFTKYSKVLDANGNKVSVRDALTLINQTLDEVLTEQEGDLDADSRWALAWFESFGFGTGDFGVAETLSKAKNTSVSGLVDAGILEQSVGKVRLLTPCELSDAWDPQKDKRFTVWEATHHMIRILDDGEDAAADLMSKFRTANVDAARELAYRLYHICEQKNRAQEAQKYNALVQSWPEISNLARSLNTPTLSQMREYDDRDSV